MKFFKRGLHIFLWCMAGLAAVCAVLLGYFDLVHADIPDKNVIYGVSFNPDYARYLHEDVGAVYTKILDDWKFRYIRLSAQWDSLEPEQGSMNFGELDWLVNEAAKRNAKVILVVGQKTPRWPECHIPEWATKLSPDEYRKAQLAYMSAVVMHYRNNPALEIWQVENEPFLAFGVCPSLSTVSGLSEELALVKQLDPNHPTLVSDSGELSTWLHTATVADYFGTTLYRVVWNQWTGYWTYNWLPAIFYRTKLWTLGRAPTTSFVTELQAEPWIPDKPFTEASLDEQYKSMSLAQLQKNVNFAATLGMPRAYLWGAEWWYWLDQKGVKDIPEHIKNLKKE